MSTVEDDGAIHVEGEYVGRIKGFLFVPDGTAEGAEARALQADRAAGLGLSTPLNALASGEGLDRICALDPPARALLSRAAEAGGLTARGWTRTLRLARTIADLEGADAVARVHVAEALIYRRAVAGVDGVSA
jgi:magnesium chelatase family protein